MLQHPCDDDPSAHADALGDQQIETRPVLMGPDRSDLVPEGFLVRMAARLRVLNDIGDVCRFDSWSFLSSLLPGRDCPRHGCARNPVAAAVIPRLPRCLAAEPESIFVFAQRNGNCLSGGGVDGLEAAAGLRLRPLWESQSPSETAESERPEPATPIAVKNWRLSSTALFSEVLIHDFLPEAEIRRARRLWCTITGMAAYTAITAG